MKLLQSRYFWVITSFILLFGYWQSCTKDDQILDLPSSLTGKELISKLTTTAPTIDGVVDDIWKNAAKLDFAATVPDPGNNLFSGYINETYKGTLRSMYDNDYIYFLAEIGILTPLPAVGHKSLQQELIIQVVY